MLRVGGSKKTSANRVLAPVASFVLPFADLGSGQVSTAEVAGDATPTFTRATTAWTKLSTGLWAPVASGTPRSFYTGLDTTVGTYAGYLAEGARTNEVLQSRAGTATNWIKTSVTAAQDQAGIDGAANSGFSLTGTGASGTCKQAIASTFTAGISRTVSCFMKRITGSGNILLSVDGGVTNVTVTPNINTTAYVQITATQSVATATFAITIVTSGDKVAVDMGQEEQAAFASTPITTTAAAVTRNADVLSYPAAGAVASNAGTVYAEMQSLRSGNQTANYVIVGAYSSSLLYLANGQAITSCRIDDSVNSVDKTGLTDASTGIRKRASSWGASNIWITGDGLAPTSGTFQGNLGAGASLCVGNTVGNVAQLYGTIKNLKVWTTQLSNVMLQTLTS